MGKQDANGISWTNWTWNFFAGCSLASPGCTNCYAMGQAHRIIAAQGAASHYNGTVMKPEGKQAIWTGKVVRAPDKLAYAPLRKDKPLLIFTNSMSDAFHETIPLPDLAEMFAIMALTPRHTYQVLTKRARHMRRVMRGDITHNGKTFRTLVSEAIVDVWKMMRDKRIRIELPLKDLNGMLLLADGIKKGYRDFWPLKNVWLGVSVEDQERAIERVPELLATPAILRFISAEPLLGPVSLQMIELRPHNSPTTELSRILGDYVQPLRGNFTDSPKINWVIVGGESGPRARPMHIDWARQLRDECRKAGTAFHFKQWGEWAPGGAWYTDRPVSLPLRTFDEGRWRETAANDTDYVVRIGKAIAGNTLDGKTIEDIPEARHAA